MLNVKSDSVEHPHPCFPFPPDATTMSVALDDFGMVGRFERMPIVPSPAGGFVVACLPFFTYGIAYGDLVSVRVSDQRFERVLKSSGLRTFRIAFTDVNRANALHEQLHAVVAATGFAYEWLGAGYVSVLIRDPADQTRMLSGISEFLSNGSVSWEVDPALDA